MGKIKLKYRFVIGTTWLTKRDVKFFGIHTVHLRKKIHEWLHEHPSSRSYNIQDCVYVYIQLYIYMRQYSFRLIKQSNSSYLQHVSIQCINKWYILWIQEDSQFKLRYSETGLVLFHRALSSSTYVYPQGNLLDDLYYEQFARNS